MGETYLNSWICYANGVEVPIKIDVSDLVYELKVEEDNKEEWVALLE